MREFLSTDPTRPIVSIRRQQCLLCISWEVRIRIKFLRIKTQQRKKTTTPILNNKKIAGICLVLGALIAITGLAMVTPICPAGMSLMLLGSIFVLLGVVLLTAELSDIHNNKQQKNEDPIEARQYV